MALCRLFTPAALALLLLPGGVLPPARGADAGQLETKRIGSDDQVTVESSPPPKSLKVLPFVEDEQPTAAGPKRAKAQPVQATAPKSNFQPHFKMPAVRQAQHVEPAGPDQPAQTAGPLLEPLPATETPAAAGGRAIIDEAFAKSKSASSPDDYTDIIDLCRRGIQAGLKPGYDDYAKRLMSWAYNRRGEAHAAAGHDQEALADFEAAVENSKNSWRAIHNRGVSYAAAGRAKEALNDFNRTIELNQQYANAYFNRGELRYQQADFAGAVADYNLALKLGPPDPVILNSRGHALYRMEQFGEALRDYGEAIRLEPKYVAALINRGDARSDLAQYGEAASDYRAAVEADPQSARAYQSAAWLMATCPDEHYRNEQLAIETARKAIALEGENWRNLETLAAAQASANQFAAAKATQEKAIAAAPQAQLVTSEKRMALYQRELAFRDQPRTAFEIPELQPDKAVRQASGSSPIPAQGRPNPRTRTARGSYPQPR